MKVVWSRGANLDRDEILAFLALRNRSAAQRTDALFSVAADRLKTFPLMGRDGALPGTRELIPTANYRIVYELIDDVVVILAVVHTSRQWPPE